MRVVFKMLHTMITKTIWQYEVSVLLSLLVCNCFFVFVSVGCKEEIETVCLHCKLKKPNLAYVSAIHDSYSESPRNAPKWFAVRCFVLPCFALFFVRLFVCVCSLTFV